MSFDFNTLLEGRASEELIAAFSELATVLETAGPTIYEDELTMLAAMEGRMDEQTISQAVDTILRVAADVVISKAGVTFDGLIPIGMLCAAIEVMRDIPDDLIDQLEDLLALETSADEVLLGYLGLLTVYSEDEWFPWVIKVDKLFVDHLKSALEDIRNSTATNQIITVVELAKDKPVVKALKSVYEDSPLDKIVMEGAQYGTSMESLLSIYSERFDGLSIEQSVLQVVSFCSLSCTDLESLEDESEFFLNELHQDMDSNHKARQELSKIIKQLEGHYTP